MRNSTTYGRTYINRAVWTTRLARSRSPIMLKFYSCVRTDGLTLSGFDAQLLLFLIYLSYSPENQKQQGCSNWEYDCSWSYNSVEDCIYIPSKANERRKSGDYESSIKGNGKRSVDRKYNGCNHACDVNISGSISLVIISGVKWKLHFPEYCTDVEYPPQSEMNDGICLYYACNTMSQNNLFQNKLMPQSFAKRVFFTNEVHITLRAVVVRWRGRLTLLTNAN